MVRNDGSQSIVGEDWSAEALALELLKNADIMMQSGGGITFSGGEPLAQPEFLEELISILRHSSTKVHLAIETSGYAFSDVYRRIISKMNFVYQDIKHHGPDSFRKWTGGVLGIVLENFSWLKSSGIPFAVRVPVIPGVNDSDADRTAFAALIGDSPVEYLPYNSAAGTKYPMLGRKYGMNFGG